MSQNGVKLKTVESTQKYLKDCLRQQPDLPDGFFVLAETQTQGRGRGDHEWNSVAGNLHVSILLKNVSLENITWTPLWISICVHSALVSLGVDGNLVQIKWPNDLWINHEKKIGGVICEKIADNLIVGIGLNLLQSPHADAGVVPSRQQLRIEEVLEKILIGLKSRKNPAEIRKYYEHFEFFSAGDWVTWKQESTDVAKEAQVVGLGNAGELLVKIEEKISPLFSEDVRSLRPKNISSK